MSNHPVRLDRAIAETAETQWGVISRAQLHALGATNSAIDLRIAGGRLHRVYRGVYAVGHRRLRRQGWWMAAVLVGGPGAVLSHRSAAALWELRGGGEAPAHVTVPTAGRRPPAGIRFHRATALRRVDVTQVDGIPCTTPMRALLDVAGELDRPQLGRVVEAAERLGLLDLNALPPTRGHRGAHTLTALLAVRQPWTRSSLERALLEIVERAGLPAPITNGLVSVDGDRSVEADAHWPDLRLVVEVDGWEWHHTRAAIGRDRDKDAALIRAGWRVHHFADEQIERRPHEVEATLRALLAPTG